MLISVFADASYDDASLANCTTLVGSTDGGLQCF